MVKGSLSFQWGDDRSEIRTTVRWTGHGVKPESLEGDPGSADLWLGCLPGTSWGEGTAWGKKALSLYAPESWAWTLAPIALRCASHFTSLIMCLNYAYA